MNATQIRPNLTPEIVAQLRAFNEGDIYAVRIVRTVKSKAGNVIIGEGVETWGMRTDFGFCVWTADTHYAGVKSSSVPAKSARVVEVSC